MSTDPEASEAARSLRSVDDANRGEEFEHAQDPLSYRKEILSIDELKDEIKSANRDDNVNVTLSSIVMARYLSQKRNNPEASPEERKQYNKLSGQLLEHYEDKIWVQGLHFCSYIPAGVVLSLGCPASRFTRVLYSIFYPRRARILVSAIHLVYLPEATETTGAEIEAAIWKCYSLSFAAMQRRGGRQYYLMRNIYSLLIYLLSLADAQAMPAADSERVTKAAPTVRAELNHLKQSLKNAIVTEARHDYLLGMFSGVIFLMALVEVLLQFTSANSAMHSVLGVIAAGGLGATLSVMSRLTANRLKVDAGAGTALIRLAGGFRPVVGAIFGLALYSFIQADLLPIKLTVTGQKLMYFYLAVAFLAGFSERFAQDAITKAGATIVPDSSPAEDRPKGP